MSQMAVLKWFLELHDPRQLRPPATPAEGTRFTRVLQPEVGLARWFYRTVGDKCQWRSRLAWTDQQWKERLCSPGVELWVSWFDDPQNQCCTLTGFAELEGGVGEWRDVTRIAYMGLLPDYWGRGLGGLLLTNVVRRAWTLSERHPGLPVVRRITVDTQSLDSEPALPNYCARGFTIVERKVVENFRQDLGPPVVQH